MEHAGVAITITTITDLAAFTIASLSSKVFFVRFVYNCFCWKQYFYFCFSRRTFCYFCFSCRSFCYYAILSLSFVYLYICTFFLAALTIDQKRIDAGRCRMALIGQNICATSCAGTAAAAV